MKKVEVLTTCDPCAAWAGREVSEDVVTERVGEWTVDLCPAHRSELSGVLAMIAEFGARPVTRRKRAQEPAVPAGEATKAPSRRGGARARQRRENAKG